MPSHLLLRKGLGALVLFFKTRITIWSVFQVGRLTVATLSITLSLCLLQSNIFLVVVGRRPSIYSKNLAVLLAAGSSPSGEE